MQDILTYTIFRRKEELLAEFAGIQNPSGTRIIIFNVRTTSDGKPEFDFSTQDDIRIPEDTDVAITKLKRQERQNHIPESDYSLRVSSSLSFVITTHKLANLINNWSTVWTLKGQVNGRRGSFFS